MNKKSLLKNLLPTYEKLEKPLTIKDEKIELLFEIAGDGWVRNRCPNRTKPYCGKSIITKKTIYYEDTTPQKDNSLIGQLMAKSNGNPDELYHTTLDLILCRCTNCGKVWLETCIVVHNGTKPDEPISNKEIRFNVK